MSRPMFESEDNPLFRAILHCSTASLNGTFKKIHQIYDETFSCLCVLYLPSNLPPVIIHAILTE